MELENGVMDVQETSENAGGQELEQGVASPDVQNVEAEENSAGEEPAEAGQAQEAQIPNDVWKTARLRAEREAATRYARQQAQQDAMVAARFGHLKVPGTDRNIRTVKDYFDALDAQNKAQTESRLKAANIDPKIIDRAVAENPIVQKAAQVVEQAQRDAGDRILKRQLEEITKILCVFLCAQKLLGKFWLNKVQVLILRTAARGCLGNGEQRYSSCVPYRSRRCAVKHRKPCAVYDVQFISKLPSAAACVRHAAIYFLFAQIQFRSCMYKKFAVLPSGKHAVDACGVLRYGFISHTLTHLARHIAYHVLPVGAAAFIHVGRAVSVIYAIELIHI